MPRPPRPHGFSRANKAGGRHHGLLKAKLEALDGQKATQKLQGASGGHSKWQVSVGSQRAIISRSFVDVLRCGRRAATARRGNKRCVREHQEERWDDDLDIQMLDTSASDHHHFISDSDSPFTPAPKSSVSLEVRFSSRSPVFRSRTSPLPPLSASCGAHQEEEDYSLFFREHFFHLCNGEEKLLLHPASLDYAPVIPNDKVEARKTMLDRIVRAHLLYALKPHTLYLAVSLLDECLTTRQAVISFELLAPVALLVAAKFEEELKPELTGTALIEAMGGQATKPEFEAAERALLAAVEYRMHRPTPEHHREWFVEYVHQYEEFKEPKEKLKLASQYLCELALLNEAAGRWAPSLHAAAMVMLAGTVYERPCHVLQTMAVPDDRRLQQLRVILRSTCSLLAEPSIEQHAIFQKYAGTECSFIAPEVHRILRPD